VAKDDPHFRLRLPAKLKASLEREAKRNNRSINAEIVFRLETLAEVDSEMDAEPPAEMSLEHEVIANHMVATTAAFQVLVLLLETKKVLKASEFASHLDNYLFANEDRFPEAALTLLEDLRNALAR
jgi:hypothetical protein